MIRYPKPILILWLALLMAGCAGIEHSGPPRPLPSLPAGNIGLENVGLLGPIVQFGQGLAWQATFDPTGKYMALNSTSGVYLYDTQNWEQQPFAGGAEPARKLAFSPDGRYLALATSRSARLQLWDLTTNRLKRDWPAENSTMLMLAFSAEGDRLASVSFSAMRLYTVDSDSPPRLIAAPEGGRFMSGAFSGDFTHAATVLSGVAGDSLAIWRLDAGEMVTRLEGLPGGWFDAGRFQPGGNELAALQLLDPAGRSAQLVSWTPEMAEAGRVEWTLEPGDPARILSSSWAFLPEGGLVAAGLSDGRVILWSAVDGAQQEMLSPPQPAAVELLLPTADGRRLAVVYADGTLGVWGAAGTEQQTVIALDGDRAPIQAAIHPDGRRLAAVMPSGEVALLDMESGATEATVQGHMLGAVRDLDFSPDGQQIASASSGGVVQMWDAETGAAVQQLGGSAGQVDSVAFSPAGDLLATGIGERVSTLAFDDSVQVWRLADAVPQWRYAGDREEVAGCTLFRNRLAFTPDGSWLAATSHDFAIHLWRAADGVEQLRLVGHSAPVMDLAISPDGVVLASASQDGDIRLWSLPDGSLVRSLSAGALGMLAVAFSPDGRQIAGGSFTGELFLWDVESGRLVRQFEGGMTTYSTLAFSPDGSLIAAGNGEGLQLWSVESGQPVRALEANGGDVSSVAFSPDGSRVAFGSEAGVIQVWGVPEGE